MAKWHARVRRLLFAPHFVISTLTNICNKVKLKYRFFNMWIKQSLKIVQIQSFFWPFFSRILTDCEDLQSKYPCSVQITRDNTDQEQLPTHSEELKIKDLPAGSYMFKVKNRNARTTCEICAQLFLVFLLFTLTK